MLSCEFKSSYFVEHQQPTDSVHVCTKYFAVTMWQKSIRHQKQYTKSMHILKANRNSMPHSFLASNTLSHPLPAFL